jgi:hypothetical protein
VADRPNIWYAYIVVDHVRQAVSVRVANQAKATMQRDTDEDAGLKAAELRALLHDSPSGTDDAVPTTLAPYLVAPAGLSEEAYKEWLDRVCAQPADAGD